MEPDPWVLRRLPKDHASSTLFVRPQVVALVPHDHLASTSSLLYKRWRLNLECFSTGLGPWVLFWNFVAHLPSPFQESLKPSNTYCFHIKIPLEYAVIFMRCMRL
jgi:hypothetical protein